MTATFERSLSRASNISIPISSPQLSINRDVTPTWESDSSIAHLYTRVDHLEATVLTRDEYVDRRNKEDQHIRREFKAQRSMLERIEGDVKGLKKDMASFRKEVNEQFCVIGQRFATFEQNYTIMDKVRFNSISTSLHAPIQKIPRVNEDGTFRYPKRFPSNVWQFWCLLKPNKLGRLIDLAEFYEVGGYQYWGDLSNFEDSDRDSEDSSDERNTITRVEAARRYPEACHSALAASVGLDYRKIRKEVEKHIALQERYKKEQLRQELKQAQLKQEQHKSQIARQPKRPADEVAPNHDASVTPSKQAKYGRRLADLSPEYLQRLVQAPPSRAVSKSSFEEPQDIVIWRTGSDSSVKTVTREEIINMDAAEIRYRIDRGKLRVQDMTTEELLQMLVRMKQSAKAQSSSASDSRNKDEAEAAVPEPSQASVAMEDAAEDAQSFHTISTEVISRSPSLPATGSPMSS